MYSTMLSVLTLIMSALMCAFAYNVHGQISLFILSTGFSLLLLSVVVSLGVIYSWCKLLLRDISFDGSATPSVLQPKHVVTMLVFVILLHTSLFNAYLVWQRVAPILTTL